MTAPTPGPWCAGPDPASGRGRWQVLGPDGGTVLACGTEADATLAAGAPDLLAALRLIASAAKPCRRCEGTGLWPIGDTAACPTCGGTGETCDATGLLDDARAAIARTRGRRSR